MKQEADEHEEAWTVRNGWVDSIRMRADGWVPNEDYSNAKEHNERLRKELAASAEPNERNECWQLWPFKDDEDKSEWVDQNVSR